MQNVPGNANSVSSTYGYDDAGRLTDATHTPVGGGTATAVEYGWDPDGNLVQLDTAVGGTTTSETRTYDEADRLTGTSTGITYGYDADSNITSITDGAATTTYSYNGLNELSGATTPGGDVSYGRDGLGASSRERVPADRRRSGTRARPSRSRSTAQVRLRRVCCAVPTAKSSGSTVRAPCCTRSPTGTTM